MFPPRRTEPAPRRKTAREEFDEIGMQYDAFKGSNPEPKWGDTARKGLSSFGSSLKNSAVDTAKGFGQMFGAATGSNPMAAFNLGQGLMGTVDEFRDASPGGRTAIVGEQLTGIPFRQIGKDIKGGEYAKAAGSAALPLGLMGLGARGLKGGPRGGGKSAAPKPNNAVGIGPVAKAPQKMLGTGSPRFTAGPHGTTDSLNPPLGPVEAFGQVPVSAGMGRTPAANMSPATRSFEALVPERYKGDVTPDGLDFSGAGGVPPPPMLPPEFSPLQPLKTPDLNVGAQKARDLAAKRRTEPKAEPKPKAKEKKIQTAAKEVVEDTKKRVSEVSKADIERPFKDARDKDLEFLAKSGNKNAIKEVETRKGKMKEAFAPKTESKKKERISAKDRMKDETGSVGSGTESTMRSRISNEEGAVSTQMLKDLGVGGLKLANQVRVTSMLSGLAPLKSILGNVGAHGIAALEGSNLGKGKVNTAPLKELLRLPTNAKNFKDAWKHGANPAHVGGFGKLNIPGRVMGAADQMSQKSLQRAGETAGSAQEMLLTSPNPASKFLGLDSPVGEFLVPFKKTPFNQLKQGLTRPLKHPVVGAGAAGAGALAEKYLSDDPKTLGLLSSIAGPYALPFLLGSAISGQSPKPFQGASPIPEWGLAKSFLDPLSPFKKPAAVGAWDYLTGQDQRKKKTKKGKKAKKG